MFLLNGRKLLAKIAENWPAKVLSIALAIILFIFHRMSLVEERFLSIPLNVETDNKLAPAGPYPRMVRITLRGDANSIYPILENDIRAYVDFTKYTEPGMYRAPIQIRKQGTALGVETLEISAEPLEIVLILDERLSKAVSLRVNFRGSLDRGYELISYTLDPTQVVIDGPVGILEEIAELSTDYIELTGRKEDFSASVRILNQDPLVVIRGNGTTEFHGQIREHISAQNYTNLPIKVTGLNDLFTAELDISSGSVRIEGGQTRFKLLNEQAILLSVDCSTITEEGSFLLPVSALAPALFTLLRSDPEKVMVNVRRKLLDTDTKLP
jgi:YbbR domain-containing protein